MKGHSNDRQRLTFFPYGFIPTTNKRLNTILSPGSRFGAVQYIKMLLLHFEVWISGAKPSSPVWWFGVWYRILATKDLAEDWGTLLQSTKERK
jgi:hypothetical protein